MKTTLDLPDDLVKEVELRAIYQRRKLKDVVADLLREGLVASTRPPLETEQARITTDHNGSQRITTDHNGSRNGASSH